MYIEIGIDKKKKSEEIFEVDDFFFIHICFLHVVGCFCMFMKTLVYFFLGKKNQIKRNKTTMCH